MAFIIRDLLKEDRPGWENLWGGYLDFYEAQMEAVTIEVTCRAFSIRRSR